MPTEPLAGPIALVFPGQGAHCLEMLDPFRSLPGYATLLDQISDLLGFNPLRAAARDPNVLATNTVSSLLTASASILALDRLRSELDAEPIGVAGYSVGQWTALYAAGAVDRNALCPLVNARAGLMDGVLKQCGPSGMLAVIGLKREFLAEVCDKARASGYLLEIANENAPGQFTLSGEDAGLIFAEEQLRPLKPRRMQRLPVAGAWHGSLMRPVVARLASLIGASKLGPPAVPVIDNTTGGWLPEHLPIDRLARQVALPVLWMQGVRTLIAAGARTIIEVGYGDMLSQFGFFIGREVKHVPLAPPARRSR